MTGRGSKTVWVEGPSNLVHLDVFPTPHDLPFGLGPASPDLTRVTPAEAQRRVDAGLASVLKAVDGSIKRIRMNGYSVLPGEMVRQLDLNSLKQEHAESQFRRSAALGRQTFEQVVLSCMERETYRTAAIQPGPANPWTVSTLPPEACITPA